MAHFPGWLHLLALLSVSAGIVAAVTIALDEWRHPQKMAVMNAVWPLTALFGHVIWLGFYYRFGRACLPQRDETPMGQAVIKGTSHCGAGCALGDLVVEGGAVFLPALATAFGYGTLFGERTFALWIPDFLVAFGLGIVFQYFSIKPMRDLSPGQGLVAALKADTASITAWQVGMYGAMAIGQFLWFRPLYGGTAAASGFEFWFLMQLAMLAGFATSLPVNWWLVRSGVKERM